MTISPCTELERTLHYQRRPQIDSLHCRLYSSPISTWSSLAEAARPALSIPTIVEL